MNTLNRLFLCFIILLTTACSPVYQTSYEFRPPETESGRHCANKCLAKHQECEHQCQNLRGQCESRKEIANIADMLIETWEKNKHPNQPDPHRYKAKPNCEAKENQCFSRCDSIHRMCHENCGGIVIREVECIRNCDKA